MLLAKKLGCHHWVAMMDVNYCVMALFLCHVLIKILVMNSIIDVKNSVLIKILVMSSIIDVKNSVLIEILVMSRKNNVLEILYVWLLRTHKKYKKRMCQDNITRS